MVVTVETPAQERLVEELLAWSGARPEIDRGLAPALRGRIEDGIAAGLAHIPDGQDLYLGKTRLDALACDGRYLDLDETPFAWNANLVRGKLAHRAIELDWRTQRREHPAELVERAWEEFGADDDLGEFLGSLDRVSAAQLRTDAEYLVTDFRDTWPALPARLQPRLEQPVRAVFGDGRVIVSGTPDLTLGRTKGDRCRMLVVDFKTGIRRPLQERQEMRFYALLLTLKYGVAPFRWATYYVAEGSWDHEDLEPELLDSAVRRLVDGIVRAAELRFDRPPEDELRLVGGAYCKWCSRSPTCPASAADPTQAVV